MNITQGHITASLFFGVMILLNIFVFPVTPISKVIGENTPIFTERCSKENSTYYGFPVSTQLQRDWLLIDCRRSLCNFARGKYISEDYCKEVMK